VLQFSDKYPRWTVKKTPAGTLAGDEDGGGNACIMDEKELALCEAAHIRLVGTLLFCLCRNEATEKFP
jgi:hypothetical protein